MGAPKGNQHAVKAKIWTEAIETAMSVRMSRGDPDPLIAVADSLIDMALEKDLGAIKEIGDRLEGKTRSMVEHHMERRIEEMSRDELIRIAGSARAIDEDGSESISPSLRRVNASVAETGPSS